MTPEVAKALADSGPWAVVIVVGAMIGAFGIKVIQVLWKAHLDADAEDRRQRDEMEDLLRQSLANLKDSIAAWNKRNEQEAARQRRSDR